MIPHFVKNCLPPGRKHSPMPRSVRNAGSLDMRSMRMDLITAGEEAYAAMRRSTNGGGENSSMLEGEDDYYELFCGSVSKGERPMKKPRIDEQAVVADGAVVLGDVTIEKDVELSGTMQ